MDVCDEKRAGWWWFGAFAGVFAVLVAYVFWGTWSMDVAPVMPDCPTTHPSSYSDVWARYIGSFLSTGKILPTDLLWSGILISPYFCQELQYASGAFFSALGLAYYLRGRGLSHLASYGAGLLLSLCGYWFTLFSAGHGGWFVWMTYGVFAFGLVDRAVRLNRMRYWLLLGLDVAWAGFQQQDLWLLFTLFTALYFLWCCVRERIFPLSGALAALAIFALVGLPNFKDTFQNVVKGRLEQISQGGTSGPKAEAAQETDRRWEFVTNWSMPPEDTREFVQARVHGDTSCPFVLSINARKGVRPYTGALGRPRNATEGNYRQHSLYVGWVTILFAIIGLALSVMGFRRNRAEMKDRPDTDVLFFAVAALIFYALSLGRYFEPAYRMIFSLPAGDLIRCPVKWHHLTELCLAILAAHGIDRLRRVKSLRGGVGAMALSALVLLGAANLAGEAKRFCAPVYVGSARRTNSTMQMTVLPRQQFNHPQVAALVRAGRVVSIASYLGSPDYFVVGILEPWKPTSNRTDPLAIGLGLVSLLAAGTALFLSFRAGKRIS